MPVIIPPDERNATSCEAIRLRKMRPRAFINPELLILVGLIALVIAVVLPVAERFGFRGRPFVLLLVPIVSVWLLIVLLLNAMNTAMYIRAWWRHRG